MPRLRETIKTAIRRSTQRSVAARLAYQDLWRRAQAFPSIDLCFAETKSLNDVVSGQNLITFTRASTGTYVGADGLIKTAAVDEPRFDHNPTTGESLGLLVEEQRTNIWLNSQNASFWTSSGASSANDYTIAPDGTQTASRILFSGSTSAWSIVYQGNFTGTYIWSAWLKTEDGSSKTIYVTWGIPDAAKRVTLNIDGTWKRYSALVTPSGENVHLGNHNTITPPGWSAFNIHIWGAQLEAGTFPTSYIPTTSSQVTRSADVASITGANFTRWYSNSGSTLLAYGASDNPSPGTQCIAGVGGLGDGAQIRETSTQIIGMFRGTYGLDAVSSALPLGLRKMAIVYAPSTASLLALNGSVYVGANSSSALTLPSGLGIGASGEVNNFWNGTVSRLTYWQSRLPNSTLQNITL